MSAPKQPADLTDQHKISVEAFKDGLNAMIYGVVAHARQIGVRIDGFEFSQPCSLENDGNGFAYIDTSEKADNQGHVTIRFSMDPDEPIHWPALPQQ